MWSPSPRRSALLLVLLVAPSFVATSAVADARSDARAKLVEGAKLLDARDFAGALARFEAAYALVQSPKIHYNFGLAYRGLGRHADALAAFEEFLAKATDAAPDTRRLAEKLRGELAAQVSTLRLDCNETGAAVTVDGRPVGHTPLMTGVYLDPGPHFVRVEKTGMQPFGERVIASAGAPVSVVARLVRAEDRPALVQREEVKPTAEPKPRDDVGDDGNGRGIYRGWGIATGVLAAGALTYGIYQQLETSNHYGDYNDACTGMNAGTLTPDACDAMKDKGDRTQNKAIGGFVAAAAFGVTSALLFYFAPTKDPKTSTAWACTAENGLRGVTCRFTF